MTNNQIQYWKLQEDKRHNTETESLGRDTLGETKRHNTADESIRWFTAQEGKRHNITTEQETERHNRADESVKWFTAQEDARHHSAVETETNRHNLVDEAEQERHHKQDEANYIEGANINATSRIVSSAISGGANLGSSLMKGIFTTVGAGAAGKAATTLGLGGALKALGSAAAKGATTLLSSPVVSTGLAGAVTTGSFLGMLKLGGAITGTDLGDVHYTSDYQRNVGSKLKDLRYGRGDSNQLIKKGVK